MLVGTTNDQATLAEMRTAGIEPDERTQAKLDRSEDALSRLRTASLRRHLESGEHDAAWALFDGLLERGAVDSFQLAVMMTAPSNSTRQRALLERAKRAVAIQYTRDSDATERAPDT